MRVSNFLLWQIAYAEIWVTDTLWPDFRQRAPARRRSSPTRSATAATAASISRRRGVAGAAADQASRPLMPAPRALLLPLVIGTIWFLPPMATLVLARSRPLLAFHRVRRDSRGARRAASRALISGAAVVGRVHRRSVPVGRSARRRADERARWSSARSRSRAGARRPACCATCAAVDAAAGLHRPAARRARGGPGRSAAAKRSCCCSRRSWSATRRSPTRGRAFGRRPLAPSISPKKTIEGAIGGVVLRHAGDGARRPVRVPVATMLLLMLLGACVVAARHRRRPVRVAAEAQRRREGLVGTDSRPRRRARPDRQLAVRRARLLRRSSASAGP